MFLNFKFNEKNNLCATFKQSVTPEIATAAFSFLSMKLCDRGVLPSTDFYLKIFIRLITLDYGRRFLSRIFQRQNISYKRFTLELRRCIFEFMVKNDWIMNDIIQMKKNRKICLILGNHDFKARKKLFPNYIEYFKYFS